MTQQWTQPLAGTPHVTSAFGPRKPPRLAGGGYGSSQHRGTDFRAPSGTPVLAIAAGRVVVSGVAPGRGQYVQVDHGGGILSLYQHLSRRDVKSGEKVKRAKVIGLAGKSGNVDAAHLHMEVVVGGTHVDPVKFLAAAIAEDAKAGQPSGKPSSSSPRVLSAGMTGDDVRELQRALNRLLPATRTRHALVVDGSFGWRTGARLRDAQRLLGLVVDEHCGPLTRKALRM